MPEVSGNIAEPAGNYDNIKTFADYKKQDGKDEKLSVQGRKDIFAENRKRYPGNRPSAEKVFR